MAGLSLNLDKEVSFGKASRGKMPTKTSINLVPKKERFISTRKGIATAAIGAVIVLLLAFLLIIRPLIGLMNANAKVNELNAQLDEVNRTIVANADKEEEYAHYTYEGLTSEEMSSVDRVQIMKLVQDALINGGVAKAWTLSGNVMYFEVSGASLAELNQIAAALEQQPVVERCVINAANKDGKNTDGVAVSFVIYLVKSEGGDEQ